MYNGRFAMRNEFNTGVFKMFSSPIKTVAVIRDVKEARSSGTRLDAVRSSIITSTAKIIAATGALNKAASEAEAAQPMSNMRRLNVRLVCRPISDPTAAADCNEGPSNPPDPPSPTESELVIKGANIQVRLILPCRCDSACKMLGTPGPG